MFNQIVLVSKEGTKFTTSSQISNLSGLIHNVLQDYPENEEIALPFVGAELLQHILNFANHHNFTPPEPPKRPVISSVLKENLSDDWDATFAEQFNMEELIEVILGTNYLDMKSLLDICLVSIACSFKDKNMEEIRKEYGITEQFTPEIEEKLKTDHPWALEVENSE